MSTQQNPYAPGTTEWRIFEDETKTEGKGKTKAGKETPERRADRGNEAHASRAKAVHTDRDSGKTAKQRAATQEQAKHDHTNRDTAGNP